MISPNLYKNSRIYDCFIRRIGYERGIHRFLREIGIEVTPECRILDVGCGTGMLGLYFLGRLPGATLVATDIEPNFLRVTLNNAERRGIDRKRITVGTLDISSPRTVTVSDGTKQEIEDALFDLICVGAALGYADDAERSIRLLLKLLAPGGYLINVILKQMHIICVENHFEKPKLAWDEVYKK